MNNSGKTGTPKRHLESPTEKIPEAKKMSVGNMTKAELAELLAGMLNETKQELLNCLKQVSEDNKTTKVKIEEMEKTQLEMSNRIEKLENLNRRKNLVFINVPKNSDDCETNVLDVCRDTLQIVNIKIQNAFYLDKSKKLILAEFSSTREVSDILANGTKLAGTKIYINRDYSREVRTKRAHLFKIRKILLGIKSTVQV